MQMPALYPMIRNLAGYRLQGSSAPFQAWLFQIAHNLVTDYYRRSSIHPQVELAEDMASTDTGLDAGIEHHLNHESLRVALSELNED